MRQSLQDIVKDSKDKDLVALVRKIENSYILKGLDWFDKKSMLKRYFPESKVAKGVDKGRDLLVYGSIGLIPGDKQEKYTKYLGYDKFKFTRNSIAFGYLLGGLKLGLAALCMSYPPVAVYFLAMGLFTLADDTARLTYSLIKKKPVGTSYIEIPYRIGRYLLKRGKEKEKNIKLAGETKSLNTSMNINLS